MRRFLVCIHDATPAYARETRMMIRDLAPLVGRRLSFAVVPDWHGDWSLATHPDCCRLVRDGSSELLIHGYFHRRQKGCGPVTWLAGRSDEMNGLDPEETRRTLERGQRVPARNEEALIGEVVGAILTSVARASGVSLNDLWLPDTSFEVVVADDGSDDATPAIVGTLADDVGVRLVRCIGGTGAAARNAGVAASSGRVLCFVDADTIVLENAVDRILELHEDEGNRHTVRVKSGETCPESGSRPCLHCSSGPSAC